MPPQTPNFDQAATVSAVDQQKAALLAALAQGGSSMAQQQAQTQSTMGSSNQYAAQQAAARAVNPQQAQEAGAAAGGQGQMYAGIAAQQAGASNTAMSNMQAANANYMGQVGAAVPLAHEQTQRELNSLQSAASQAQADRNLRSQIAAMQLKETQARIGAAGAGNANDKRRLELEDRRLALEEGKLNAPPAPKTPAELYAEDRASRGLAAAQRGDTLNDIVSHEGTNAGQALSAAVMGKDGQPVDSYAAALAQLNMMYENGQAKTPKGKELDRGYMMGLLAQLYGISPGQAGPDTLGGGLVGRAGGVSSSAPVGGLRRPGL